MADVPQRIWAWVYADPWGNELRWFEWQDHTPDDDEAEYILATPEALAAQPEVQALIRAAKAEGMREAADMLMQHFGVPLRPAETWSDAEKKAYEFGQREVSALWRDRIFAAADALYSVPGEINSGCCCIGPTDGEPECPCKMRARREKPSP